MNKKLILLIIAIVVLAFFCIYQIKLRPVAVVDRDIKVFREEINELAKLNNISFQEAVDFQIRNIIEDKEIKRNNIAIEESYINELIHELEEHESEVLKKILSKMSLQEYKENLRDHHLRLELFHFITNEYQKSIDISDNALHAWLYNSNILDYNEDEFNEFRDKIIEKMLQEKSTTFYNEWLVNKLKEYEIKKY